MRILKTLGLISVGAIGGFVGYMVLSDCVKPVSLKVEKIHIDEKNMDEFVNRLCKELCPCDEKETVKKRKVVARPVKKATKTAVDNR